MHSVLPLLSAYVNYTVEVTAAYPLINGWISQSFFYCYNVLFRYNGMNQQL